MTEEEKIKFWGDLVEPIVQMMGDLAVTGNLEYVEIVQGIIAKAEGAAIERAEKPKYRRGDRLLCLETDEYCVIYISGNGKQYVKFPNNFIGEYTNAQVADLFDLVPKELEEPVAWVYEFYADMGHKGLAFEAQRSAHNTPLYTATPQRKWIGLTDKEYESIAEQHVTNCFFDTLSYAKAIEAKLKQKNA